MTESIWFQDPSVLFHKTYIFMVWPTEQMTFEAKINAITRFIIILTIFGYIITRNFYLIIISLLTVGIIYSLYKYRKREMAKSLKKMSLDTNKKGMEGFDTNKTLENQSSQQSQSQPLEQALQEQFYPVDKKNPFGNVLLTEINDTPDRLAAQPAFNPDVYDNIDRAVKKQTQTLNPTIQGAAKELYGDLYDNFKFDTQMMQRFYTTANSRVANDQGAFAQYLYGDMHSAKESTPEGAWMRVKDNERYLLH